MPRPTEEAYSELQQAYDHFNEELFDKRLPQCLMTLQRKSSTRGYFSHARFINRDSQHMDEIAMNPEYFPLFSIEEVLSTVVHEMVHQEMTLLETAGRGRYHNKAWGERMELLGLMPSATGLPGGKRTGDRMTHYIVDDGLFQVSCRKLLTQEFTISWMDRFPPRKAVQTLVRRAEEESKRPDPLGSEGEGEGDDDSSAAALLARLRELGVDTEDDEIKPVARPSSNRYKYRCVDCGLNVWGKLGLNIVCGDCDVAFENTDI